MKESHGNIPGGLEDLQLSSPGWPQQGKYCGQCQTQTNHQTGRTGRLHSNKDFHQVFNLNYIKTGATVILMKSWKSLFES